eukprot:346049-Chlamydomonas_euryale.AAC.2
MPHCATPRSHMPHHATHITTHITTQCYFPVDEQTSQECHVALHVQQSSPSNPPAAAAPAE